MTAKKASIVVADDDPRILRLVKRNLELAGYQALAAYDGEQALEQVEAKDPDLMLLDVNMPILNGFEVCERVREFSTLPIIIVTARDQERDLIRGIDLGADDYLTKPFGVGELLARVRAVLRRSQWKVAESRQQSHPKMSVGDLTIDFGQQLVTVCGQVVELTPVEFRLLAYLARNVDHVVTPDLLLEHVWGNGYDNAYHLLIVNINRLRRKVEREPGKPIYIVTRKGIGYFMPSQPVPSRPSAAAIAAAAAAHAFAPARAGEEGAD